MELTNKLINLLEQYILEYKNLKSEYHQKKTMQALYEEIFTVFDNHQYDEDKLSISILLNTIYGDNIYVDEFYRILLQRDNQNLMQQFIYKLNQDYQILKNNNKELKSRIDRNYMMFTAAKRVKTCLKYHTPISKSKNDIFLIQRILNYYEISGIISKKEELLLINEIEIYNRMIESKKGTSPAEKDYTDNLYNEIPNILTIGFQEHDNIEVSKERKNTLDKFATEIINLTSQIGVDEINNILTSYQQYKLDNSEYNYIIVKVMDTYLEELITLYELLIDKDIYSHRKERIDVVKNYYQTLEKYLTIKSYYDKETKCISNAISLEPKLEDEITSEPKRRLIYSRSDTNIIKAKIISDMSNISYEYYQNIYDLLEEFKQGTLGNKKIKTIQVGNKSLGHIELKNDNVRIILKRVKDNIYNVLGVFIKKANNDMGEYRTITNRQTPDISTDAKLQRQLELSAITEEELAKIVEEKARKNGRK